MDITLTTLSHADRTVPEDSTTPSTGEMDGRGVQAATEEPLSFTELPIDIQELILIFAAKEQAYTHPHLGIKNIAQTCKFFYDIMNTNTFSVRTPGLRRVKQLYYNNQLSWGSKGQPEDLGQVIVQKLKNKQYDEAIKLMRTAILLGKTEDIKKLFTSKVVDSNATDILGYTPLHRAACSGNPETIQLLIDAGANVHATDIDGSTPLHKAAFLGNPETIQLLINAGANIHATNNHGHTPLHQTICNDYTEVVRLLADAGANIHATDNHGNTPLHWAASDGNPEAALLLIDAGANIHATNILDRTPLHYAASNSNPETVQLLIDAGANIHVTDNAGHTPLHGAKRNGNPKVIRILKEAAAERTLFGG